MCVALAVLVWIKAFGDKTGSGLHAPRERQIRPGSPRELINRWQKALTPGAAGLPARRTSLQLCITTEQLISHKPPVCCLYVVIYSHYNRILFIQFIIQTIIMPFFHAWPWLCLVDVIFLIVNWIYTGCLC